LIYGLKKLVALGDSDIEVTAGFFVVPELPLGIATALILMLESLMLLRERGIER